MMMIVMKLKTNNKIEDMNKTFLYMNLLTHKSESKRFWHLGPIYILCDFASVIIPRNSSVTILISVLVFG